MNYHLKGGSEMRLYWESIVAGLTLVMSLGPRVAWARNSPSIPKAAVRMEKYDLNGVHGTLEGQNNYLCRIINGSLKAGDKNSAMIVSEDGLKFSGSSFRIEPTGKNKAASLAILYGPGPFGTEIASAVLETKVSVTLLDTAKLECKVIRRNDQDLGKLTVPSAILDAIRKPVFQVKMVISPGKEAHFFLAHPTAPVKNKKGE